MPRDGRSTCKIVVTNNNVPFPVTLLFLTDILRVWCRDETWLSAQACNGKVQILEGKLQWYFNVTTLLIKLFVIVVLYGVQILIHFHSVYYFYCLTS